MFFHMAEYCDTLHSKEKRNREYKACLNERAILHLLDHDVTWKSGCFSAPERGGFLKNSGILQLEKMGPFWGRPCRTITFYLKIFFIACSVFSGLPDSKGNSSAVT